ncbi:MAG: hypothetical protein FWF84_07840, partial [Kiritimatiellaeota bacterium]|nr:hypothetical protein [Kiritimatiellota bacterium]
MKLEYDGVAQAALLVSGTSPRLSVQVFPNNSQRHFPIERDRLILAHVEGVTWRGFTRQQIGTLWLTDAALLRDAEAVVGAARVFNVASWSPDALTLDNGRFLCFGDTPFALDVAGDVAISGLGSGLFLLPLNQVITVGGNLTVESNGQLWIEQQAELVAETDFEEYGSLFEVGGDVTVGEDGLFRLIAEPWSGAPVKVIAANVTVDALGVINADASGFMSYYGTNVNAPGIGGGPNDNSGGGGGYGGVGGHGNHPNTSGGATYGDATRPVMVGSPGGGHPPPARNNYGGTGGGLIWIEAPEGAMALNGTLSADGGTKLANNGGTGSGGGIYLVCKQVTGTGTLSANGATNDGPYINTEGGAGGGGRIAIAGWSDFQFAGTAEALGIRVKVYGDLPAEDGTVEFVPGPGFAFTVIGEPYAYGVSSPYDYGKYIVDGGELEMSVPLTADDTGYARQLCTGYFWDDDTGASGSGATTNVTLDIVDDTRLTWVWTNQWAIWVQGGDANGTLVVNNVAEATGTNFWATHGETLTVEAIPSLGGSFLQWWGEGVTEAMAHENPLTLSVERSWNLTAAFVPTFSAEVRTWAGGDGAFEAAGNWSPAGVPGPFDVLTISEGEAVLRSPWKVASLTLDGTARLVFTEEETRLEASGAIFIDDGATVTHSFIGTNDLTQVSLSAQTITIAEGGLIDVTGMGYAGGTWVPYTNATYVGHTGQGPSGGIMTTGNNSASGAGHGGAGAWGSHNNPGGGQSGDPAAPTLAGSGGGGYSNGTNGGNGSAGGGVVRLVATNLVMDGIILASGADTPYGANNSGAGAGGSIWITADTLSG